MDVRLVAKDEEDPKTYTYTVRLGEDLAEIVKTIARRHRRSMREEMIMALENWADAHKNLLTPEQRKALEG